MAKTYPPELEQFVQQELANGRYQSEDELVIDALTVFREMKQRHEELRRDVQQAIAEADSGETKELDIEEVIARGCERLADEGITD